MILRQGGEQVFHRGVVAECLAEMMKAVDVAGAEDEAAAELKGIFTHLVHVLSMSRRLGALACGIVVPAKDMQQIGFAESGGTIGLAIGVDEQRKGDASLVAEAARVIGVAEPDGGESGAASAESRFVFAQLRDMLPAEDSTIMAQEDDHRRAAGPQGAELDGMAVGVGQGDRRQFAAEGGFHCCTAILVRTLGTVNDKAVSRS
jgi:hypothetical protein